MHWLTYLTSFSVIRPGCCYSWWWCHVQACYWSYRTFFWIDWTLILLCCSSVLFTFNFSADCFSSWLLFIYQGVQAFCWYLFYFYLILYVISVVTFPFVAVLLYASCGVICIHVFSLSLYYVLSLRILSEVSLADCMIFAYTTCYSCMKPGFWIYKIYLCLFLASLKIWPHMILFFKNL